MRRHGEPPDRRNCAGKHSDRKKLQGHESGDKVREQKEELNDAQIGGNDRLYFEEVRETFKEIRQQLQMLQEFLVHQNMRCRLNANDKYLMEGILGIEGNDAVREKGESNQCVNHSGGIYGALVQSDQFSHEQYDDEGWDNSSADKGKINVDGAEGNESDKMDGGEIGNIKQGKNIRISGEWEKMAMTQKEDGDGRGWIAVKEGRQKNGYKFSKMEEYGRVNRQWDEKQRRRRITETVSGGNKGEIAEITQYNNSFMKEQERVVLMPSHEGNNSGIGITNEVLERKNFLQEDGEPSTYGMSELRVSINKSMEKNGDEKRRHDDIFVWQLTDNYIWRPPWRRWRNTLVVRQLLGIDEDSDTFIWRPPWRSLRRMIQ